MLSTAKPGPAPWIGRLFATYVAYSGRKIAETRDSPMTDCPHGRLPGLAKGFAASLLLAAIALPAAPAQADMLLGAALEDHLKAAATSARTRNDQDDAKAIEEFYKERDLKSVWLTNDKPNERARILIATMAKAGEHGLNPAVYGVEELKAKLDELAKEDPVKLELRLTRTFVRYANDICCGRIEEPTRLGVYRTPRRPHTKHLLVAAASRPDFQKFVEGLAPQAERYQRLKEALAKYRALKKKGGWNTIAAGPTLKPGMKHRRVAQVRARLMITGDLTAKAADPLVYDKELEAAVTRFQARHGVDQDGKVGRVTLAQMNVPIEDRIAQIIINLERRRWTVAQLGEDYIWVNIADNYLKLVRKGKTVHVARVVVGKVYHKTPIFSKRLDHIRFNPHWNVPYSIATKEMLPIIRKNPGYLAARKYMLLTRPLDNDSAIDPHSVDWSRITRRNFPYFIRQKPGPWNALGTMIFMFPNRHNVFIHDTAARSKFRYNDRFFSHGCVRVQHPHKLAIRLLRSQGFTMKRIRRIIADKKPVRFKFKDRLWVHITYMTAWANKGGSYQFRRDFYKRDRIVMAALKRSLNVKELQ